MRWSILSVASCCVIASSLVPVALGQCETEVEVATLVPPGAGVGDQVGLRIAISGTWAVVGARLADDVGENAGAAHVFQRLEDGTWELFQTLYASDPSANDWFGLGLAIDGDVIAVGSSLDDDQGPDSGSVSMFRFDGESWESDGFLLPPANSDGFKFGSAVAVSGDHLIVGAPSYTQPDVQADGAAYFYRFNGNAWEFDGGPIEPEFPEDDSSFANQVAIYGTTAVIGARRYNNPRGDAGAVFVFQRTNDEWVQSQQLTAPDTEGGTWFGQSVGIHGDAVIIGRARDDSQATFAGAVYFYWFDGKEWVFAEKLVADDGAMDDQLGAWVDITAAAAAATTLRNDNENGIDAGAVYLFRYSIDAGGLTVTDVEKIIDPDGAKGDELGHDVSVDGVRGIVGAPFSGVTGSAMIFRFGLDCNDNGICDDIDIAKGVSQDCNFDGLPDECQSQGAAAWINAAGGAFEDPLNWCLQPPGGALPALFALPAAYDVTFANDAQTLGLESRRGATTLQLNGHEWIVLDQSQDVTVRIGTVVGESSTLTIGGGRLQVGDTDQGVINSMMVGGARGGLGELRVVGSGAEVSVKDQLIVGDGGPGLVQVVDGGSVFSTRAILGDFNNPASPGDVVVDGAGSMWSLITTLDLNRGVLDVREDALVQTSVLTLREAGVLAGNGFIDADLVINLGEVCPAPPPGDGPASRTLSILGNYKQFGQIAKLSGASGTLRLDVDGIGADQFDQLVVTGTAELQGGLVVEATGKLELSVGDAVDVVIPGLRMGQFDVAYLPSIASQRFLRVTYGEGLLAGGAGVQLVVEDLAEIVNLGNPEDFDSPDGSPTSLLVTDVTQDGIDDLLFTLQGASPEDVGFLVVGVNNGRGTIGFQQIAVGPGPSALAVGLLNDDAIPDVAVTSATDDTVLTLFGDGRGGFLLQQGIATGSGPAGVAIADITGDGHSDLLVTNADDNTLFLYQNDGAGGVSFAEAVVVGFGPRQVDPADLDNDKDLEIVVVNVDDASVSIIENDGGFGDVVSLPVVEQPSGLIVREFSGNSMGSFADVIVPSGVSGLVSVLVNASGQFAPAVDIEVGQGGVPSMTAEDLDADGDLDLAVLTNNSAEQRVLRVVRNDVNEGSQLTFVSPDPADDVAVDPSAILLASGNLDGVDDPDLITLNDSAAGGALGSDDTATLVRAIPPSPPCAEDLDASGEVGASDLALLLAAWGGPSVDLDGDGIAGASDLAQLLAAWGPCGAF